MYPWFESVDKLLSQSKNSGRLAHGLLLDAPKGSGKLNFSKELSQWILCSSPSNESVQACKKCKSCMVFEAGTHPDFYLLDRLVDTKGKAKQSIGIDQIRGLTDKLVGVAQLGGWRVAIIRSVSDLTTASFNALLKTLEEPGKQTLLILLADNIQKVPATVKSRCQILKPDLNKELLMSWLNDNCENTNQEELSLILKESNNAPLRAVEMIEGEYIGLRKQLFQLMNQLLECQITPQDLLAELELNENTWELLAIYFLQLASNKAQDRQLEGNLSILNVQTVFELYDELMSYQRAQFAGSNLQAKLQFQAILIKWYEAGRKIIHFSKA